MERNVGRIKKPVSQLAKVKTVMTTLAGFKYPKGNVIKFANFLKNFETPLMHLSFEGKGK